MTTSNNSPRMTGVATPEDDSNTILKQSPIMASKLADMTKREAVMDLASIKSVKSVEIVKRDNNSSSSNKMSEMEESTEKPSPVSGKQSLAMGKQAMVEEAAAVTTKGISKAANNNDQGEKGKGKGKGKDKRKQKQNSEEKELMENNEEMAFLEKDCDIAGMPLWIKKLMENQPTLNIMTIGDVSHGKSTLMWGLCDEKTGRHSSEVKNNMTIRLGYTSCKVFKCINCFNSNNICYFSGKSSINDKKVQCPRCGQRKPFVFLVRHISFVDCPGHAEYMGTMISAACVADGAIMVIDASRAFPGKQTVQHTSAAHLLGVLSNGQRNDEKEDKEEEEEAEAAQSGRRIKVIVAQNKIDLINRQKACSNVTQIRAFLSSYSCTLGRDTPIIPISAQSRLNLDALCMSMVKNYPMFSPRLMKLDSIFGSPPRSLPFTSHQQEEKDDSLLMNIIRTFDVNRPRELKSIEDIDKFVHGGVIGGVMIGGTVSIGDTVCIRPGIIKNTQSLSNDGNNDSRPLKTSEKIGQALQPKFVYQPISCRVIGLKCGTKSLSRAFPGANVGVMLNIDPSLTKNNERVGHIVCSPNMVDARNKLPVFDVFIMSYILLKPFDTIRFKRLEGIKVNIGSSNMNGFIVKKRVDLPDKRGKGIMVVLEKPICAKIASKVTLTRKINGVWRLAAGGIIFTVRQCPQIG